MAYHRVILLLIIEWDKMTKTALKIIIAIALLIMLFCTWPFLHLFLIELIGEINALISIFIVIIAYIIIINLLFKHINLKYDNEEYSGNQREGKGIVRAEDKVIRNEITDNEKYHNPSENIPRESNENIKNLLILIIVIIAIIVLILNLTGMF